MAKCARDSVRVISWAQPKPVLPPASSRQLAARASLEVLRPFGIRGTPPPLGPELHSFTFSSANPTGHPGGLLAPDVQSVWAAAPLPLPPRLLCRQPASACPCTFPPALGVAAAFLCPCGVGAWGGAVTTACRRRVWSYPVPWLGLTIGPPSHIAGVIGVWREAEW